MVRLVKVLSLDGGGIRGIIPATVLAELELRAGRPAAELFDLIAGTSTGGILALGLSKAGPDGRPQFSADQLAELYEREGKHIFSRSIWHAIAALDNLIDEKYEANGLERVLQTYFGEARLKDAVTEVLVTAYELETREPWFFARHKARAKPDENDFPMRAVARATSAAPTYFEPLHVSEQPSRALVDGGVFANNPGLCAYVEALKLYDSPDVLVVSLGTGQYTRPIRYRDAKGWGLAQWAQPILDVVFDGVSDTVDHQLKMLCVETEGIERYYRFQAELDEASDDLDETDEANIARLKQQARRIIAAEDERLDRLAEQLVAP
jgi:patatin-like phospholipase/acyl hydrolase